MEEGGFYERPSHLFPTNIFKKKTQDVGITLLLEVNGFGWRIGEPLVK